MHSLIHFCFFVLCLNLNLALVTSSSILHNSSSVHSRHEDEIFALLNFVKSFTKDPSTCMERQDHGKRGQIAVNGEASDAILSLIMSWEYSDLSWVNLSTSLPSFPGQQHLRELSLHIAAFMGAFLFGCGTFPKQSTSAITT